MKTKNPKSINPLGNEPFLFIGFEENDVLITMKTETNKDWFDAVTLALVNDADLFNRLNECIMRASYIIEIKSKQLEV